MAVHVGNYTDNSEVDQLVALSEGEHTLNYFDSYNDGWNGGYWTLINAATDEVLAGGNPDGLVEGAGGSTSFTLGADGAASVSGGQHKPRPSIRTAIFGREITWNVDGGQFFGVNPPYEARPTTTNRWHCQLGSTASTTWTRTATAGRAVGDPARLRRCQQCGGCRAHCWR